MHFESDTWSGGFAGLMDDPVSCRVLLLVVYVSVYVPLGLGDCLCMFFALFHHPM